MSWPVRRSLSSNIALAATTLITTTTTLTATTTLVTTTTLRFTTFRLTTNSPMGDIAWRTGLTGPRGAIGDTPIHMVVHIRFVTLFPMFGTLNPKGRWRFRPGFGGFLQRGLRVTHGVDGGVSAFCDVRVCRSIRINPIRRGFMVRGAMGVGHRRLVSLVEAIESFPLPDVFTGKGVNILRLQTRPTLLPFHSVAACLRSFR